jgi:hypothetical protein
MIQTGAVGDAVISFPLPSYLSCRGSFVMVPMTAEGGSPRFRGGRVWNSVDDRARKGLLICEMIGRFFDWLVTSHVMRTEKYS